MMSISSEFRWLLLFCSLPLILVPTALLGGKIITWYGRQWNNLDSSIRRELFYFHIPIYLVLLIPIVVVFSRLISQSATKFDLRLLLYICAILLLGALYMILELYVVSRRAESQKSKFETMEGDILEENTSSQQIEACVVEASPMESNTIDYGMSRTSPIVLVAVGFLTILLFVVTGMSLFLRGITGIIGTAVSAFGLTFLVSAARKTKPSHLWQSVLIGLFIGFVAGVLFVREKSLQPGYTWNQWATLIALPVAAICGRIVAASK